MYHAIALLLPDGRVLTAGGGRAEPAIDYPSAQLYSPPYLFRGPRPVISAAPAATGYAATMAVQTPAPDDVAAVSFARMASVTHTINADQRFIDLSFDRTASGLTVAAPTSRAAAPPGYYMLFLLGRDGVPSVARVVRLRPPGRAPLRGAGMGLAA